MAGTRADRHPDLPDFLLWRCECGLKAKRAPITGGVRGTGAATAARFLEGVSNMKRRTKLGSNTRDNAIEV
jgi:hypothetical protein